MQSFIKPNTFPKKQGRNHIPTLATLGDLLDRKLTLSSPWREAREMFYELIAGMLQCEEGNVPVHDEYMSNTTP